MSKIMMEGEGAGFNSFANNFHLLFLLVFSYKNKNK